MFGKRGNNPGNSAPGDRDEPEFRPAAPSGGVAVAELRSPEPRAVPIPPAAVAASAPVAPGVAHKAPPAPRPMVRERSESYYDTKSQVFSALIDTIDLSQLAKLDPDSAREEIRDIVNDIIAIKNFAMSISEQEELLEDICNDVLG